MRRVGRLLVDGRVALGAARMRFAFGNESIAKASRFSSSLQETPETRVGLSEATRPPGFFGRLYQKLPKGSAASTRLRQLRERDEEAHRKSVRGPLPQFRERVETGRGEEERVGREAGREAAHKRRDACREKPLPGLDLHPDVLPEREEGPAVQPGPQEQQPAQLVAGGGGRTADLLDAELGGVRRHRPQLHRSIC